jgi:hypothetical protein
MRSLQQVLIQYDHSPCKRGKFGARLTQTEGNVKKQGRRICKPRREAWNTSFLPALRRKQPADT